MSTAETYFITATEAARLIDRSEVVVYRLIQCRGLAHIQTGGVVLVSAQQLLRAAGTP